MGLVTAFILWMFFVVSYLVNRELFNPLVVINLMFAMIVSGASIGLYGLYTSNNNALFVVLLGMFFINAGFFLGHAASARRSTSTAYKVSRLENDTYEINTTFLGFLTISLLYFTFYYLFFALNLFTKGYSLNTIRFFYFNNNLMEESLHVGTNNLVSYGTSYLYNPSQHVFYVLTAIILFDQTFMKEKKFWRKVVPFVTFLNILISMVSTGGRLAFFYFCVVLLVSFDVFKYKNVKKKSPEKAVVILIFCSLLVITYYVSTLRENDGSFDIIKRVYSYFCGCIPNLENNLRYSCKKTDYSYGVTLVSGFVRPLFTGMRLVFKTPIPQVFVNAEQYLIDSSMTFLIGDGLDYNAFVTIFYFFFRDMGWLGVVVDSFVFGVMLALLYFSAGKSIRNFSVYLLLMQAVFTSFIRWQFLGISYSSSFYYLLFLFRRKVR